MSSTTIQPATPISPAPLTIVSDAPAGSWHHPRLDEINRRLKRSTFGDRQIKSLIGNTLIFLFTFSIPAILAFDSLSLLRRLAESLQPFTQYSLWTLRALAAYNIMLALRPWYYGKDDLSDIPLTPTQRGLLGLGPAAKPATPGSHYVTPPRYSRSATPQSRSASGSPYSESPLSGYGGTATGNSPSASPLFQKTMNRDLTRRLSFGSPPPLGLNKGGNASSDMLGLSTGRQMTSKNASVSLNSRWLYEKGRGSPSSLRSSYL